MRSRPSRPGITALVRALRANLDAIGDVEIGGARGMARRLARLDEPACGVVNLGAKPKAGELSATWPGSVGRELRETCDDIESHVAFGRAFEDPAARDAIVRL